MSNNALARLNQTAPAAAAAHQILPPPPPPQPLHATAACPGYVLLLRRRRPRPTSASHSHPPLSSTANGPLSQGMPRQSRQSRQSPQLAARGWRVLRLAQPTCIMLFHLSRNLPTAASLSSNIGAKLRSRGWHTFAGTGASRTPSGSWPCSLALPSCVVCGAVRGVSEDSGFIE